MKKQILEHREILTIEIGRHLRKTGLSRFLGLSPYKRAILPAINFIKLKLRKKIKMRMIGIPLLREDIVISNFLTKN